MYVIEFFCILARIRLFLPFFFFPARWKKGTAGVERHGCFSLSCVCYTTVGNRKKHFSSMPRLSPQRRVIYIILGVIVYQSLLACATPSLSSPSIVPGPDTCTSPLLFVKGLKRQPTHYLIPKIHVEGQETDGLPQYHDLRPILIHNHANDHVQDDRPVRVLAVPDFCLNQTSQLRIAIWYPCADPPNQKKDAGDRDDDDRDAGEFSVTIVPCRFSALNKDEYLSPQESTMSPGREATFYLRHHDPPVKSRKPQHNSRIGPLATVDLLDTNDASECVLDLDQLSEDEGDDGIDKVRGIAAATTKSVCWLPSADVLHQGMTPLDIAKHGYLLQINTMQFTEAPTDVTMAAMLDEVVPTDPAENPRAWYGFTVHEKWPVQHNAASVFGRNYCRSWLVIKLAHQADASWTKIRDLEI